MRPHNGIALSILPSVCFGQSVDPLVTVTVRKSCSLTLASSAPTLPSYGWFSSNGSSVPYTFSAGDASFTSAPVATTPNSAGVATGEPSSIGTQAGASAESLTGSPTAGEAFSTYSLNGGQTVVPVYSDVSLSSSRPGGVIAPGDSATAELIPTAVSGSLLTVSGASFSGLATTSATVTLEPTLGVGGSAITASLSTRAPTSSPGASGLSSPTTSIKPLTTTTPELASSFSTTYVTGGSIVTTLLGGLTTSYTAGCTTVVSNVASPTDIASASAAANAVSRAVVGPCPGANSLLVRTDSSSSDILVVCGKAYNGTVLSQYTRRSDPIGTPLSERATDQDCTAACSSPDNACVAFTYALNTCILYSYVFAVFDTPYPAFSALLINEDVIGNNTSTLTLDSTPSAAPPSSTFLSTTLTLPSPLLDSSTRIVTSSGSSATILPSSRASVSENLPILPSGLSTINAPISVSLGLTTLLPSTTNGGSAVSLPGASGDSSAPNTVALSLTVSSNQPLPTLPTTPLTGVRTSTTAASPTLTVSTAISATTLSSTAPNFACPQDDNTISIVTDQNGRGYELICDMDTSGGLLSVIQVDGGFNNCFYLCDLDLDCLGWIYFENANDSSCYLKDARGGAPAFISRSTNAVSGLRYRAADTTAFQTAGVVSLIGTGSSLSTTRSASQSTTILSASSAGSAQPGSSSLETAGTTSLTASDQISFPIQTLPLSATPLLSSFELPSASLPSITFPAVPSIGVSLTNPATGLQLSSIGQPVVDVSTVGLPTPTAILVPSIPTTGGLLTDPPSIATPIATPIATLPSIDLLSITLPSILSTSIGSPLDGLPTGVIVPSSITLISVPTDAPSSSSLLVVIPGLSEISDSITLIIDPIQTLTSLPLPTLASIVTSLEAPAIDVSTILSVPTISTIGPPPQIDVPTISIALPTLSLTTLDIPPISIVLPTELPAASATSPSIPALTLPLPSITSLSVPIAVPNLSLTTLISEPLITLSPELPTLSSVQLPILPSDLLSSAANGLNSALTGLPTLLPTISPDPLSSVLDGLPSNLDIPPLPTALVSSLGIPALTIPSLSASLSLPTLSIPTLGLPSLTLPDVSLTLPDVTLSIPTLVLPSLNLPDPTLTLPIISGVLPPVATSLQLPSLPLSIDSPIATSLQLPSLPLSINLPIATSLQLPGIFSSILTFSGASIPSLQLPGLTLTNPNVGSLTVPTATALELSSLQFGTPTLNVPSLAFPTTILPQLPDLTSIIPAIPSPLTQSFGIPTLTGLSLSIPPIVSIAPLPLSTTLNLQLPSITLQVPTPTLSLPLETLSIPDILSTSLDFPTTINIGLPPSILPTLSPLVPSITIQIPSTVLSLGLPTLTSNILPTIASIIPAISAPILSIGVTSLSAPAVPLSPIPTLVDLSTLAVSLIVPPTSINLPPISPLIPSLSALPTAVGLPTTLTPLLSVSIASVSLSVPAVVLPTLVPQSITSTLQLLPSTLQLVSSAILSVPLSSLVVSVPPIGIPAAASPTVATTTTSTSPLPTSGQVLRNSQFDSRVLSPWTINQGSFGSSTIDASSGAAVVSFPGSLTTLAGVPVQISQSINARAGQTFRIQANIAVAMAAGGLGVACNAAIAANSFNNLVSSNYSITSTSSFVVDQTGIVGTGGATNFSHSGGWL
ncbi:uncharacterized protein RCC_03851 [Ramularia collo-cygni]|uniref:Apple domain-containing protein n=1 Tax=Ramularia collo-cygni TaxID=112498 RepID=A0A2D3VBZ6_9PEZI|nr:uncharacterized protein RCC_03851 [Ramularia collo-cygni]CZT18013.1 uncharacterized protein RCC_03851 [Ramularia collo-cygni]